MCREDQLFEDNLEKSVVGNIVGDSQQPAMLQDNPAYSIVNSTQQQMFVMSGNPGYGIIDEDSQQPILQSNPAYFSFNRSVASID